MVRGGVEEDSVALQAERRAKVLLPVDMFLYKQISVIIDFPHSLMLVTALGGQAARGAEC